MSAPPRVVRLGIIGLDTSHVTAFTRILHEDAAPDEGQSSHAVQVRVVAAYPGGSQDFPLSRNRVAGYTDQVRAMGVTIVPTIAELLAQVDGVLIESVDGNQHLAQAREVFPAGLPVFIDKPLAASLADAVAIYQLGREAGVPWFSCSSARFSPGYRDLRGDPATAERLGEILGCDVYSQTKSVRNHPDLFWYGVHGVDLLYAIMGRGCVSVSAIQTRFTESVRGVWRDGKVGVYRSIRENTGKVAVGVTVFGEGDILHVNQPYDYPSLCGQLATFFTTGRPPVSPEESLEVIAFLAAAEASLRENGRAVSLMDALREANFPEAEAFLRG